VSDLKREIVRETIYVASNLFKQSFGRNPVDRGKIGIQHYAFTADFVYQPAELVGGKRVRGDWHRIRN